MRIDDEIANASIRILEKMVHRIVPEIAEHLLPPDNHEMKLGYIQTFRQTESQPLDRHVDGAHDGDVVYILCLTGESRVSVQQPDQTDVRLTTQSGRFNVYDNFILRPGQGYLMNPQFQHHGVEAPSGERIAMSLRFYHVPCGDPKHVDHDHVSGRKIGCKRTRTDENDRAGPNMNILSSEINENDGKRARTDRIEHSETSKNLSVSGQVENMGWNQVHKHAGRLLHVLGGQGSPALNLN